MGKEETLLKIKAAEAEIHAMREDAERERDRILRDARREALELRDRLREEAEDRYRAVLAEGEKPVMVDQDRILAAGRAGADEVRNRGRANLDRAVDLVLRQFRGVLNA